MSLPFLLEAAQNPATVGAVLPSGRALTRALTIPVRVRKPLRILEVGAGTGVVTRAIRRDMPRGSSLDIVEANPRFASRLRREFGAVHQTYVQEYATEHRYDVIVSGLPLTNFEPYQVDEIMRRMLGLLRPGGTLTYFAYIGTLKARRFLSSAAQYRRHAAVDRTMNAFQRAHGTGRTTVLANVPPARVWRLRAKAPVAPGVECLARTGY
jgi:phosphatidylethanolamine/phosphatidyl-N-methylethanolamine N-methyltransferase